MGVTIAVATYGGQEWVDLAHARAIPSAEATGAPVVYAHADTLHDARNQALARVDTEHVVHLDADDELEPGFLDALLAGTADIRGPRVRYLRERQKPQHVPEPWTPRVAGHHHDCTADCLPEGNWLVVGSLAPTQLLRDVGGWRDFEWSEDWDLWLRCWKAGATFELIPDAIYRAWVRPKSRNRAPDRARKTAVHWQIHAANFGEQAAA